MEITKFLELIFLEIIELVKHTEEREMNSQRQLEDFCIYTKAVVQDANRE